MEAIERTLGSPEHSLHRIAPQAIASWAARLRGEEQQQEAGS
jgi:hypothetical protein